MENPWGLSRIDNDEKKVGGWGGGRDFGHWKNGREGGDIEDFVAWEVIPIFTRERRSIVTKTF